MPSTASPRQSSAQAGQSFHIHNSGFESVFGQPDGYMDFKEREPEAAQVIERMMIDRIRGTRQRGWLDP